MKIKDHKTITLVVRAILMPFLMGLFTINCGYGAILMDPNHKTPRNIKSISSSRPVMSTTSLSIPKARTNTIGQNAVIMAPHGGSAENALLIIDPTVPESMYIGNYFKNARNIPDKNVFYMNPTASDYNTFASVNLQALFGTLAQQQISHHINYIIITPFSLNSLGYKIPDSGHLSNCCDSGRFSISSAYTLAFMYNNILSSFNSHGYGGFNILTNNNYSSNSTSVSSFDSSLYWSGGQPTTNVDPTARFFLGALLGYVGTYPPNTYATSSTVNDITAMIDRSVAADGTHPSGTFYFMNNTADSARNARNPQYSAAVSAISSAGGQATILNAALPLGKNDVLGIMSGFMVQAVVSENMTLLPGAFADHMTSYAGQLDNDGQEVFTDWIIKGASGSDGTVEEPCVYTQKFPNALLHYYYFKGLSLGEAYFRSMLSVPIENLFGGDPLTRPFGYLPIVNVTKPADPVSGVITISPTAQNTNPGASGILGHDLYIDGILKQTVLDAQNFQLDTTKISEGFHDIRVVSYDNSAIATPGRWVGQMQVNNYNRGIINLSASPSSGNLSTIFSISINSSSLFSVYQVRLLQNNRVIAATSTLPASFNLIGSYLGAGPVKLIAEVEYTDGVRALSQAFSLNISFTNKPVGTNSSGPLAFSYTKDIPTANPILVELPAIDNQSPSLTYSIVQGPSQGSVVSFGPAYGTILLEPQSNPSGTDTIIFRATSLGGSAQATVNLRYAADGDISGNGTVTMYDAALAAINVAQGGVCTTTALSTTQCLKGEIDGQGNGETLDSTDIVDIAKQALGVN